MSTATVDIDAGRLFSAVKATFDDPMADLATSGLVLGGIFIVFLLVIAVLYLTITPGKRKVVKVRRYRRPPGSGGTPSTDVASTTAAASGEASATSAEDPATSAEASTAADSRTRAQRSRTVSVVVWAGIGALVVGALVAGYAVSGTQQTCATTCHLGQERVAAAHSDEHARCTECHERPGLSGVAPNAVQRTRMAVMSMLGAVPERRTLVRSATCIGCHAELLESGHVTEGPIRMSHAEPAAAGVSCLECHTGAGHGDAERYSMEQCAPCHGAGGASNECGVCHAPGPRAARKVGSARSTASSITADAMGSGRFTYPVVRVGDIGCGGCHDEPAQCDGCHGLRMPHSEQFKRGGHARMAAFERKEMCVRCHKSGWCSTGCHIGFETGHVADWKTLHQEAERDATCGCHATRSGRTTPMCDLCHDF